MDQTKSIAIYGRSGHGSVIADIAYSLGYEHIIWIDDAEKNDAISFAHYYKTYSHVPVALGIGNNAQRRTIFQTLQKKRLSIATLIHPSAVISPSAVLGMGSVVMPLAVINAHAKIGAAAIINSASVIEHDCHLEDFVHISPNASLAGNVKVGESSHIGVGASIIQNLIIGEDTTIGAGSVVINDIPSHMTAYGVPCKVKQ